MRSEFDSVIQYELPLGEELIPLNPLLGREIRLTFEGNIYCVACGVKTKKSYNQGFCYPCFISHPACAPCVIRPELCEAHKGIARDMDWAREHCLKDHYVYLSLTSNVKVGVTRKVQIPYRWIDQGAVQAIKLARTPNRYLAGVLEVRLKKFFADRTDWRKMLRNDYPTELKLPEEKKKAIEALTESQREYVLKERKVTRLQYPVEAYPEKVKSVGFDKVPKIQGKLVGIKGQYLIFENNEVLNIRKHAGYEISFQSE